MNNLPVDSIFNIAFFVFILALLFGLVALLVAIQRFLSKWLGFLQEDKIAGAESIKQDAYKKASRVLDSAREESLSIVTEATAQAKNMLDDVADLSEESKESFKDVLVGLADKQEAILEKTGIELSGFYEKTIKDQEEKSLDILTKASEDVEEEILHEVEEFKDILHKETVDSQRAVEAKLQKEYDKVSGEIDTYRKDQLGKIDQSIFSILHDVSTSVFGKALAMDDHETLVLEALEEAKSRNIFSS